MLPKYFPIENSNSPAGNQGNINIRLDSAKFAHSLSFFCFTFNTITTIYSAYINDDFPMVAFITCAYATYLCIDLCMTTLSRMPINKASPKKTFLKVTIWGLSTALFFGFAYQFSTFMRLLQYSAMYAIAIAVSAFLFYSYFVHDYKRGSSCGNAETVKIVESSCRPEGEDFKCESSKLETDNV